MTPVVALVTLLVLNTAAGTAAEIGLSIDRCAYLPRDEVVRLVTLELGATVLAPSSAGSAATRVEISCDGSKVGFTVSDPQTGKRLNRALVLTARTEHVATRIVAVAVSELVIASWMELTTTPAGSSRESGVPAVDPSGAAPGEAERQAPHGSGTGYLLVLGQAIGPFSGVGLGWGGGFRVGWTSGWHWIEMNQGQVTGHPAIDLDLTGSWTEVGGALGTIHVSMWSAAPRASFKIRRGRAWLDLGAGGRFGLARLVGAPLDPLSTRGGTLAGTWAGPAGYLGGGLQLGRLVLAAGVETGYVLRSVAGLVDDGMSVAISGHWVSGSVAMGWGP